MNIELKNVSKVYKTGKDVEVHALNNINLEIRQGDYLSICGVSGSGKSTLLHLIGCLDKPTQGDVIIDDKSTSMMGNKELASIRNSKIGFVFQDYALIPYRNVYENLIVPAYFSDVPRNQFRLKAECALAAVGMEEYMKRKVNTLSGGQKQRVAIARALMMDPDLILADEPSGALDTANSEVIIDLFKKINDEGKTIIVVTHDMKVAEASKRLINLRDGKIEESGAEVEIK